MDINFEKNTINVYGKNMKIETVLKKLTQLSGEQAYHFLINRGIQLPRKMNSLALMSVLNRKIKFLHSNSLSKDYFTRLQYYKYFTEQQLFNLYMKIANTDDDFYLYRYNLFKLILINFVALDLNDGELTYLINLKKNKTESFEQYFNYISGSSLEQENTFDGEDIEILKEQLAKSASNQEVFDIAGKYGIDLPQRLKKEDFLTFIIYYMKQNNTYNDEINEELQAMSITQLTTYARRTAIPMQPSMSKQELITYLFYYIEQCEIEQTSVKRIEIPNEFIPLEFTVDLSAVTTFKDGDSKKIIHYENDSDDLDAFEEILKKSLEEDEEEIEEIEQPEESNEKPIDNSLAPQDENQNISNEESIADAEPQALDSNEEIMIEDSNEPVDGTTIEESNEIMDENPNLEVDNQEEIIIEDVVEDEEAVIPQEEAAEPVEQVIYVDEFGNEIDPSQVDASEDISDEEIQKLLEENNLINNEKQEEKIEKTIEINVNGVVKNDQYNSKKLEKLARGNGRIVALSISGVIVLAVLIFCLWALLRF